jgi:hypothetical protein
MGGVKNQAFYSKSTKSQALRVVLCKIHKNHRTGSILSKQEIPSSAVPSGETKDAYLVQRAKVYPSEGAPIT